MSNSEAEESVEIILNVTKDKKTIKLTFKSTRPMDTHDLIVVLEDYLQDLLKAYKDSPDNDEDRH